MKSKYKELIEWSFLLVGLVVGIPIMIFSKPSSNMFSIGMGLLTASILIGTMEFLRERGFFDLLKGKMKKP